MQPPSIDPGAPIWVTPEKIAEYERNNPDHAGIGRIMVDIGAWILTDDPRLNCRVAEIRAARGRC